MSDSYFRDAWDVEADYLYPALPATVKQKVSKITFADELYILLKETGDTDGVNSTPKGEEHGLRNENRYSWDYDDEIEGRMIRHTHSIVYANEEGSRYLFQLMKTKYPGIDESIAQSLRRVGDSGIQKLKHKGFDRLPASLINYICRIVKNENQDRSIYLRCFVDDVENIIGVFDGYHSVLHMSNAPIYTVDEIETALKCDSFRNTENRFKDILINSQNTYFVIDRAEEVFRARNEFERTLLDILRQAEEKKVTIVFLSTSAPKSIYGLSAEMERVLSSSHYYDCREECIDRRIGEKQLELERLERIGEDLKDPDRYDRDIQQFRDDLFFQGIDEDDMELPF